ncbi:putative ATP-dependent RNA helicase BoYb [Drosophila tropicalis]|uniref:putative ATP-dependent RNA helicase BoYb n=1 Tax=Drosophila tropicalis TaxID=46794 RepID=UPI0035AC278E
MFNNMQLNQDRNNSLRKQMYDYEVQESFPVANIHPLEAPNCSEYVVAHVSSTGQSSKEPPQAIRDFSEVLFLPYILETMRKMGFNNLLRLQSYAWPHLNQGSGHGAIIVSAPRSGRSLCYIPPMCQAIGEELKAKREAKLMILQNDVNYQGAVALVIVSDLKRAQQIAYLCHRFLRKSRNEEWLTLTLTVPSNPKTSDFYHRLLNGAGCLVATISQFNWLCEQDDGQMQFPNLRFVVYDDIDLMDRKQLEQGHHYVKTLIKGLKIAPQSVIISLTFRKHYLKKLMDDFSSERSLVIFGDLLEAALYGGTLMRLSLVKKESKLEQVLKILKQRPPQTFRTFIYCQDDVEIKELIKALWMKHKYECLAFYQDDGLDKQIEVNKWLLNSHGLIFVCTDNCPELDIRNIETLINYSMSTSWSKFKMRYLCLSQGIMQRLSQEALPEAKTLLSLTLLDDQSDRQLPRLVDFLEMHQEVDQNLKQIVRSIRDELNLDKSNEPALCPLLLTHGECRDTMCNERHQLNEADRLPLDSPLLEGVNLKVQLVKVYSPSHLCVRLLEYLSIQGSWQKLPLNSTLDLRLQLLQANKEKARYWPPRARDICVYLTPQTNSFERVQILCVPKIKHINIYNSDLKIEVQALDVDTRLFSTRCGQLYECPDELKKEPRMSVDMRLLGVVPSSGELSWHPDDEAVVREVKSWLTNSAAGESFFLQANIKFAMTHTIFINDLVVVTYVPTFKKHVRHLRLVNELQKMHVERSETAVNKILEFFKDHIRQDRQEAVVVQNDKPITEETPIDKGNSIVEEKLAPVATESQSKSMNRYNKLFNLAFEISKKKKLQDESQKVVEIPNSTPPVDSIGDLLKCMMNCATAAADDDLESMADHEKFFEYLLPKENNTITFKTRKSKNESTNISNKSVKSSMCLPQNVVQPEVMYYQTVRTLELQVILPEEDVSYNVILSNLSVIIFLAQSTSTIYQFVINTFCPYQSLSHHMKGRCVYVKVLKTLARPYPLEFSHYTFMKPNHDHFHFIENYRKQYAQNVENYILKMGYAWNSKFTTLYKNDESEERDSENELDDGKTERANNGFECD